MRIKNITSDTVSVDVFGDYREIRSGWGLTEQEVGGKDILLYIAFKLQGKIEVYDDNDQLMEFIHCPLCGNVVKIAPAPEVIPTVSTPFVEIIEKEIKQPVKAEIEVKQKKVKNRVKKLKK